MPTTYKRKNDNRAKWSADALRNAIECVQNGTMGVNEAARNFGIPKSTLKDRIRKSDTTKIRCGPSSCLGDDAELKLVRHIKKLQQFGFAPDRESVRIWAFKLAEQMQVRHRFNKEIGKAGYDWLHSFLRRHPDISVRKAEGISINRATGMNRETVKHYFELLEKVLTDNKLYDKPSNVFNMDETGLQLNNKPTQVLAAKGSKNVSSLTSGEKGETISVIACCNAEGMFLPPYSIFKGKNRKEEFLDGMPPGSQISIAEKSAYVNASIFKDWLQSHFLPRKPAGTVLLIVDGHTSHTNSVEVLEFCEENIVLLCLPSHTTHYLQPLDRSFFKSLKNHYYAACNNFLKTNPTRKLGRLQFGTLLGSAWGKSATVENGMSGFRATGIAPFNPVAIPEYAYVTIRMELDSAATPSPNLNTTPLRTNPANTTTRSPSPQPGCSHHADVLIDDITPGKLLDDISPVPKTSAAVTVKKRGRQLATILNTSEKIHLQKEKNRLKKQKNVPKRKIVKKTKKVPLDDSSDSGDESPILEESEESIEEWDENDCTGCGENYFKTTSADEWVQCVRCSRWYHNGCSKYDIFCDLCGKFNQKTLKC